MGLLARKINHDLIEEKIPFSYPTEPPALVQTVGARLEFLELFGAFCRELARVQEFFQFRVHFQECTNYDERSRWRGKSLWGVCVERELWERMRFMRRSERDVRVLQFAIAARLAA